MNRIFWVIGLLLLVGTLVGVGFGFNNPPPTPTETPAPPAIMAVGYVDGEKGVAKLSPLQQGLVVEVAAEGTVVKKGDVILRVDPKLAKFKVDEADADLNAALEQQKQSRNLPRQRELKVEQQSAAVAAVKLKKLVADNELKSKLELAKDSINVSKTLIQSYEQKVQEIDELVKVEEAKLEELKLLNPKIDMSRADAEVAAKETRKKQAQWALDQCELRAPSDGSVLRVHVNKDEILGPSPMKPAIEFLPAGDLIVRAEVLQEWASHVKLGQPVEITDDTYQGAAYPGEVYFLSPLFAQKRNLIIEPFTYNDVRFLECLVRVKSAGQQQPPLRVGQRVRVKIKS